MSKTISKAIGEGHGKGELWAALAYNSTDKFGGMQIKGVKFSPVAGKPAINIGDSTTAWTALYTDKAISIYSTCASVNASSSFEPVLINTVMTGIGQVGGRVRVNMETDVALGAWANALKASIDFSTTGSVTGLGSAFCAEMTMMGQAMPGSGNYAVLELELICPENWSGGNVVAFIHAQVGAAASNTSANFVTNGFLLDLTGMGTPADDTAAIFHLQNHVTTTHALRIRVDGVAYDIPLVASTYTSN